MPSSTIVFNVENVDVSNLFVEVNKEVQTKKNLTNSANKGSSIFNL